MPYGKPKRTYGKYKSLVGSRRTRIAAAKSSARKATIGRARAHTSVAANRRAVLSNARLVNKNALAIKRLKFNEWGPIQSQTSSNRHGHVLSQDHPICFHVNNMYCNADGPFLYRPDGSNNPVILGHGSFDKWVGVGNAEGDVDDADMKHVPNGPKLKLLWATFDFEFAGYMDNCAIRIDFVRQKKLDTDFYSPAHGVSNFLPHSVAAFNRIAGFCENRIDRTKYEVLKTKHLYINSRGLQTVADASQDRMTTEPTTSNIKRCRIALKMNKICKMLRDTTDETSRVQSTDDTMATNSTHYSNSSWGFDNQHPLSNVFCILSTSDTTGIQDFATGDRLSVKIIRKMTWQDPIG